MHHYIPDFMLEKKNKDGSISTLIVEVKPFKQTKEPVLTENTSKKTYTKNLEMYLTNQAKWDAAKKFCKENRIEFVVLTEKELM